MNQHLLSDIFFGAPGNNLMGRETAFLALELALVGGYVYYLIRAMRMYVNGVAPTARFSPAGAAIAEPHRP